MGYHEEEGMAIHAHNITVRLFPFYCPAGITIQHIPCSSAGTLTSNPVPIEYVLPEPVCPYANTVAL